MKICYLCSTIILIMIMVCFTEVSAEQHDDLAGRVGVGFVVIDSGNNLNPNGSDKRIDDLNSAAERKTTAILMVLPAATWDVGEPDKIKLYFGTEPPIDEVGGFAMNFGCTYDVSGTGILDTSMFFTPFEETWENPYETGVKREKTSTSKYGLKVALNRIMGTGLRISAVYMNDDVEDDMIGALMPDLERDGAVYSLNANYSFYLSETLELRPRFSLRKGDYKGESNSFTKYKAEFEMRYRVGRLMIKPRIFFSHSDYDHVNPIFGITRENDSYGGNIMTTYMAPFGFADWSVQMLAGYSKGDANIDFYDNESITFGTFASYHF